MADPEGAATPDGGAKLLVGIIFAENCIKMKKYWTETRPRVS